MSSRARIEVTWQREVADSDADGFYGLYHAAFSPLTTLSAVRQLLTRPEFDAEMSDDRLEKIVARDATGSAVGLTIVTNELASIPWISPEFYAARYPEHAARRAVYYVAFVLTHPAARRTLASVAMLDALIARLTAERAVGVYDICAYNDGAMRLAEHLRQRSALQAEVDAEVVDVQTFYALDFKRPVGSRTVRSHAAGQDLEGRPTRPTFATSPSVRAG